MIFKPKLRLPPEFILNSQNIKIIESSLTKSLTNLQVLLIKKYYISISNIVYKIIKKIKYCIILRNIRVLFSKNIEQWYALHVLQKKHLDIVMVQLKMRIGSILAGAYQFERLYEIELLFQKFRPVSILEYGSGTSSSMFAKLAGDDIYFQTTDEMKEWLNKLFVALPSNLKNKINAVLAKTKIEKVDSELVISYDTAHDRYFDFVYVDGPFNDGLQILPPEKLDEVKDTHGKHLPNYDVELLWENGIYPKYIVIDGRRSTVRRLILKGAKHYRIYLKSVYNRRLLITNMRYYLFHTILIRKDIIL